MTLIHYELCNQNTDEDSFPLCVPGERVSTETAINTAIRTDSLNTLDVWAYPCISLPSVAYTGLNNVLFVDARDAQLE